MEENRGCSLVCAGLVGQGTSTSLCVACRRTIFVYELNRTKQRYRRVKDITCPGTVQYLSVCNERLCVGYPSSFAIYSIQGDGAPVGMSFLLFYTRYICTTLCWHLVLMWLPAISLLLTALAHKSSWKIDRQAFFGLPLLVLPPAGVQAIAYWTGCRLVDVFLQSLVIISVQFDSVLWLPFSSMWYQEFGVNFVDGAPPAFSESYLLFHVSRVILWSAFELSDTYGGW